MLKDATPLLSVRGVPQGDVTAAALLGRRASILKSATFDLTDQRGHHAWDRAQLTTRNGTSRDGNATDQSPCVGMLRSGENIFCETFFDDLPCIHDGDTVRDTGDHAQIVGDEHHRDSQFGL